MVKLKTWSNEINEIADVFQRELFGVPFKGIPDDAWVPMTDATIAAFPGHHETDEEANTFQAEILAEALVELARRVRRGEDVHGR